MICTLHVTYSVLGFIMMALQELAWVSGQEPKPGGQTEGLNIANARAGAASLMQR